MAEQGPSLQYRRLRAPRNDGEVLLEPNWQRCQELAALNRTKLESYDFELLGRSFQSLRKKFRCDLLSLARTYTSEYADVPSEFLADDPIILSGHQPRLFHPGVWAKNFAAADLARQAKGIPVHVIIDNDVLRENKLRVPIGTKQSPKVAFEPFDRVDEPMPFEFRNAIDRDLLSSFPSRVVDRTSDIVANPLVEEIWPDVLSAIDRDKPLGWAFAEARHKVELRWGLQTLEVPLSLLCATETFRWFVFSMLAQGDALTESYNQRLQEYRDVHRLRSAAQPLPDLRSKDGWTEAPFWLMRLNGDRAWSRRPLWWRHKGYDLILGDDRFEQSWTLAGALSTPEASFETFQDLCDSGLLIRPRALTNTMLLRLLGSDVFIHGIGGAKYDQVTNLILHDLFSDETYFDSPGFISLSKTLLLPTGERLVSDVDCVRQRQHLREIYFHPERYLSSGMKRDPQVSCIVEKKAKFAAMKLPRGERLERHRTITQANAKLREFLQEKTEILKKNLDESESRLAASNILGSREWSYCLFPAEHLRDRLLESMPSTP